MSTERAREVPPGTMGELIFRFRRRAVAPEVLAGALRRTGPIAYGSATYETAWGDEPDGVVKVSGRRPGAQPACAVAAPREAAEAAAALRPAADPRPRA